MQKGKKVLITNRSISKFPDLEEREEWRITRGGHIKRRINFTYLVGVFQNFCRGHGPNYHILIFGSLLRIFKEKLISPTP